MIRHRSGRHIFWELFTIVISVSRMTQHQAGRGGEERGGDLELRENCFCLHYLNGPIGIRG